MTNSILKEKDYNLDINKYKSIVSSHKESQKNSWIGSTEIERDRTIHALAKSFSETKFCGYENYKSKSKLLYIIENNKLVESVSSSKKCILVFDKTPFYAESGGQVSDKGEILDANGIGIGKINDVKKMGNGAYLHYLEESRKNLEVNKNYFLEINKCNREVIRNNHSATHLLHESLRRIVGEHVTQKGSLVNEKKLRFDYSSNEQLSKTQIYKIESLVNNTIRSNVKVEVKKKCQLKKLLMGGVKLHYLERSIQKLLELFK